MKNKGEKVDLGFDNYLQIEPSKFEKKYGVLIRFHDDEGKEKSLITFEIEVKAQKSEGFLWVYRFIKKNIRINDQEPHENLDVLGTECNLALYPMELEIGWQQNRKRIGNSEEIRANWEEKRKILKDRFELELTDWYLKTTDENINNDRLLYRAIGQDIFLSFFLAPIYRVYGMLTNSVEIEMKIPILPNTMSVSFLSELKVNQLLSKFGTITLEQEGILNEERSAYDLVTLKDIPVTQSHELKNGHLKTRYQLDKESKTIHSVIADCSIELPYGRGRSFRMEAFEI